LVLRQQFSIFQIFKTVQDRLGQDQNLKKWS